MNIILRIEYLNTRDGVPVICHEIVPAGTTYDGPGIATYLELGEYADSLTNDPD